MMDSIFLIFKLFSLSVAKGIHIFYLILDDTVNYYSKEDNNKYIRIKIIKI